MWSKLIVQSSQRFHLNMCQLYKALGGIIKAIYKEKSSQKRWGAEGCGTVPTSMHWSSNPRGAKGTGTVWGGERGQLALVTHSRSTPMKEAGCGCRGRSRW